MRGEPRIRGKNLKWPRIKKQATRRGEMAVYKPAAGKQPGPRSPDPKQPGMEPADLAPHGSELDDRNWPRPVRETGPASRQTPAIGHDC